MKNKLLNEIKGHFSKYREFPPALINYINDYIDSFNSVLLNKSQLEQLQSIYKAVSHNNKEIKKLSQEDIDLLTSEITNICIIDKKTLIKAYSKLLKVISKMIDSIANKNINQLKKELYKKLQESFELFDNSYLINKYIFNWIKYKIEFIYTNDKKDILNIILNDIQTILENITEYQEYIYEMIGDFDLDKNKIKIIFEQLEECIRGELNE